MPLWTDVHIAYGLQLKVADMAAQGGLVAGRFTERGTMRVAFRGRAATDKSYTLTTMELFRFADGNIVDRRGARDSASMMRQLGVSPA